MQQQQLLYLGESGIVVQQQQADWGGCGIDMRQQPPQQIFWGDGCILSQEQQQNP